MTNFKIGQKVVCVNANIYLIKHKIYTIEKISMCSKCRTQTLILSEINEAINNSCTMCGLRKNGEHEFMANRFRPLTYNSATQEILEKFKLTEEKSDVEIKEYENV